MKASDLRQVDLAIIGGGINGAGLAALAAHAGLSVALFEKGDFASGASSKSTKLIHGGIRYLEQRRLGLVFESLHERRRLLNTAPHLVRPLPFLLPSYRGDQRSAWVLKAGLWLYDLLAGFQNISRHHWLSPSETLNLAPLIKGEGLTGCGLYYDAQVNDARLVLENILAAEKAGAHCFNYCHVTHIDQDSSEVRVSYHDDRSNKSGILSASCLVNASGPWANQTANLISRDAPKIVRPTRGTHIVVPEVLSSHAVLISTPEENRIIFVIPWRGASLVGTTDLDDSENPDKTKPTEEEIRYLLREAARVLPGASWKRDRVLAAFAGLRPLAWSEGGHASSVSREDKIIQEGRVLTIVGGKLTTYQAMSRKALKEIRKTLQRRPANIPHPSLPGAPSIGWKEFLESQVPRWAVTYQISKIKAFHLANLYGQVGEEILKRAQGDSTLREPLHSKGPEISAEVVHAVQEEKAFHLEDVMLRRLEIGYGPHRWGEAAEKTSRIMGNLLEWGEKRRHEELTRYHQELFPAP